VAVVMTLSPLWQAGEKGNCMQQPLPSSPFASFARRACADGQCVDPPARQIAQRAIDQPLAGQTRDPGKGGLSISTVKCDSPVPSSPI
jgi:hypothetical protein